MDSVYDAAKTHAEKLKAELEALQTFLDLYDRFRDHFGLTPSEETSVAPAEAEAPLADQAETTHEIRVQEPEVESKAAVEETAPELEAAEPEASEPEAIEKETSVPLAAKAEAPAAATADDVAENEPRVIKVSEGVLIAAPAEPEPVAPLGPEATLQSVAEKLAATISATHPSVTGYTV